MINFLRQIRCIWLKWSKSSVLCDLSCSWSSQTLFSTLDPWSPTPSSLHFIKDWSTSCNRFWISLQVSKDWTLLWFAWSEACSHHTVHRLSKACYFLGVPPLRHIHLSWETSTLFSKFVVPWRYCSDRLLFTRFPCTIVRNKLLWINK